MKSRRKLITLVAIAACLVGAFFLLGPRAIERASISHDAQGPRQFQMVAPQKARHSGIKTFGRAEEVTAEALNALGYLGEPPSAAPAAPAAPGSAPQASAVEASQTERYLIRNATLTIETEDAHEAAEGLVKAVKEAGGYVGNLSENVDGLGRRCINVQIRVPADAFDVSMGRIEGLGRVLHKQVSAEDVTEQYIDTDARARNLKRTEERLLDHLDRTGKLEDIVKVEHELTRVREQVERLEGQLRYLSNRVAFSTIHITLQERPKAEPILPEDTFSTAQIASEATRSLVQFGQGLWARLIWLGIWSPVWGVILLVALMAWRVVNRGSRG